MYKEKDILNKEINEKSSKEGLLINLEVINDQLFVLNLRYDGVNEVKNR